MTRSRGICVAGDGWGAAAALRSFVNSGEGVTVVTNDPMVRDIAIAARSAVYDHVTEADSDCLVMAGLKQIVQPQALAASRVLNIHYSLLPKYRGLHSTVWAILNGESEFGLTVHEVVDEVDAGPIVYQYSFDGKSMDAAEVMNACNRHVEDQLFSVVCRYLNGEISPRPQNHNEATWVCRRNLEDCLISWNEGLDQHKLTFRALVPPYPRPMIKVRGLLYEVVAARFVARGYRMHLGRVANCRQGEAWVKTTYGFLVISKLKKWGAKSSVPATEILNVGMRLDP